MSFADTRPEPDFQAVEANTLKERFNEKGNHVSNLSTVIHRIERELQSRGSNIGYRSMWQRLAIVHDLVVAKETVRHALRILHPEGVDAS